MQVDFFRSDAAASAAPEVRLAFQQYTYLLEKDDPLATAFTCDETKSGCKVNIDLAPSFSGVTNASAYKCRVDFGFTGAYDTCNPPQVTYPEGEYRVLAQISLSGSIVSERAYSVRNRVPVTTSADPIVLSPTPIEILTGTFDPTPEVAPATEPAIVPTPSACVCPSAPVIPAPSVPAAATDELATASTASTTVLAPVPEASVAISETPQQAGVLSGSIGTPAVMQSSADTLQESSGTLLAESSGTEFPTVRFVVQSGVATGTTICSKEDCVVNFVLQDVSGDALDDDEWHCSWNTGGSPTTTAFDRCNPSYWHYPIGNFHITARTCRKSDATQCRDVSYDLSNPAPIAASSPSGSSVSSASGGGASSAIVSSTSVSASTPVSSASSQSPTSSQISASAPVSSSTARIGFKNLKGFSYDGEAVVCAKSPCTVPFVAIGSEKQLFWDLGDGTYVKGTSARPTYSHSGTYSIVLYRGTSVSVGERLDEMRIVVPSGLADVVPSAKERELFLSFDRLMQSVRYLQRSTATPRSAATPGLAGAYRSATGVSSGGAIVIENAKSVRGSSGSYVCESKKAPCMVNLRYSGGVDATYEWNF